MGARLLFFEADDSTIVKRYKETRRNHPLQTGDGLLSAIEREKEILAPIRDKAEDIIDTTGLSLAELRAIMMYILDVSEEETEFEVSLVSFGFKHGIPEDGDMVFDVRCFPNPFYIDELKNRTGNDKEVQDYVLAHENAREYLDKIIDMISYIVPVFKKEGRYSLVVAVGCTGGHHRSVTFVNKVADALKGKGIKVNIVHRELK